MYRIVAAVSVAVISAPLPAQTAPPSPAPVLTLAAALDRAGVAAPSQDAADAGRRAAQAERRVAALRPNPSLTFETENAAGTGSYDGLRSAETTVGMAVPIELGGKRGARIALADARIGRATLDTDVARADLRLRVTRAYAEAAAGQRRVEVARDQQAVANEALRVARARVRAGRASPLEEQRALVAGIAAAAAAARAERSAGVALAVLARLTGGAVAALDLDWFDRLPAAGTVGPVDATLSVALARADTATAQAQVRLANSQRLPDLTLTAGVRRLEQTNDVAAVVGIAVPLRLFNRGRAAIDVSVAQRDQTDALRRAALLDAELAIVQAQADADNAATTARAAAGPALDAAREAARIARIGYREGKFAQIDLLDAERTLADTRTAAIDALATFHDARARLDRLTATASPHSELRP